MVRSSGRHVNDHNSPGNWLFTVNHDDEERLSRKRSLTIMLLTANPTQTILDDSV